MTDTTNTPTVKMTCSTCWGWGLSKVTRMPLGMADARIGQIVTPKRDLHIWYMECPECGAFINNPKQIDLEKKPMIARLSSGIEFDARLLESPAVNFHREQDFDKPLPDGTYTYTASGDLSDGTKLEAKGLGPNDMKEFYEMWVRRRNEIKAGKR